MSVEMITALSSIALSLFTLVYTVISNDKQSVLQNVTANRMNWIQQVRELLGEFSHAYRTHNTEDMADIEARLELFITSFQVFGRTYPTQKAHYSGKNESGLDFLPLWEAPLKASKI